MGTTVSKEEECSKKYRPVMDYRMPPTLLSPRVNRTRCDAPTPSSSSSSSPPLPPPLPSEETSTSTTSSSSSSSPPPPPSSPDAIQDAAQSVSSIPNPGPYDQMSSDSKRLVSLDTFDGFRFDISKPLSPFFVVVHSFWIGSTSLPNGRSTNYTFISQVADDTGRFFLARAMTDSGSIHGRLHYPLLGGALLSKLDFSVTPEAGGGGNDQCIAELDIGGATWMGNLKYGSVAGGLAFGINYLQAITPRLMVGGEGLFLTSQGAGIGSYSLKYTMPAPGGDEDNDGTNGANSSLSDLPSSSLCCNFNAAQSVLSLNYKRVVTPKRVTLGAELTCNPFQPESAQVVAGAEFQLSRSKVHMCLHGDGKLQSTVEAKLGMGPQTPTLQFAAELDHWNETMKFGYGLNIES